MPELIKNCFNKKFITSLASEIQAYHPAFDKKSFSKAVFDKDWDKKELKDRMRHISLTLGDHLPENYKKAVTILKKITPTSNGFEYMLFPDFIEVFGLEHYSESIKALEHFTKQSSSEFAVRPFIIKYKTKMMRQMAIWASSDNHHVRRLASEGCRPRLPWAMSLPEFKQNPKQIIKIISKLRNDESEYVRRSVANNLNDISKDHPDVTFDIANKWIGKNANTDRLVKHACRTLLKKGEPHVLKLFGFAQPQHIQTDDLTCTRKLNIGDNLIFSFNINSKKKPLGQCRVEYAINFVRENKKLSRKVFKISEGKYNTKHKNIHKKHSFKLITTRKYYPGLHKLTIIINGVDFCHAQFELTQ